MPEDFPGFLNLDVDLASSRDLDEITAFLRKKDLTLHCAEKIESPEHIYHGMYLITLEDEPHYKDQSLARDPICYLQYMVTILRELQERFPAEYASLETIDFDLGFEETDTIPNTRFTIPHETLQAITELGGTITWTLYAASRSEPTN